MHKHLENKHFHKHLFDNIVLFLYLALALPYTL